MIASEALGSSNLPRKNVEACVTYVKPEIKQALEDWAEKEHRSLSSLLAHLLTQAVEQHQATNQK